MIERRHPISKRGQHFYAQDALPHLLDGAFFLLEPKLRKNGQVYNWHIVLILKDGTRHDGPWGAAKRQVEKLGVLQPFFHNKAQAWRHKKVPE